MCLCMHDECLRVCVSVTNVWKFADVMSPLSLSAGLRPRLGAAGHGECDAGGGGAEYEPNDARIV